MFASRIFIFAGTLILLAVLITAIYFAYYRSQIEKRLASPSLDRQKSLWSPLRVCLTSVIGVLVLFAAVSIIIYAASPASEPQTYPSPYHAEFLTQEDMASGYLSAYSDDENPGYTKYEEIIGDVKYTYFISDEESDAFHPAFIVKAEYVGKTPAPYQDASVSFLTPESEKISGIAVSAYDANGIVWIVGNAFNDCKVSCIVDFYSDDRKEFDLEKLEKENTPLLIALAAM